MGRCAPSGVEPPCHAEPPLLWTVWRLTPSFIDPCSPPCPSQWGHAPRLPVQILDHPRLSKDTPRAEKSEQGWLQQPRCPWKFAQPSPTEKLKEGALKHTRLSKEAFNHQFFVECLWEFAQPSPPEKLKKAALTQTSVSKDGFNNQSSKAFLAGHL